MHIYQAPLLQLTIDLWNTTTLNTFNIKQNAHPLRADGPPPIGHRCMEYHYTKNISQIAECTCTKAPCQSTIDLWNTTTSCKFHI